MTDPDREALRYGREAASKERLRKALEEAFVAYQRNPEESWMPALDAVINSLDFLPFELAEPLRNLKWHLYDTRPSRNQKGRGHRKKHTQAVIDAKAALLVDFLMHYGIKPTINAACESVSAAFKDRCGGDWRRLKTHRYHLRKGNGQPEALRAYWSEYQRVLKTKAEVTADLGGETELSTLEKITVANISILDAMTTDLGARWLAGDAVEASEVATLMNTFNRSAATLGWQRRAKDVTPDLSFLDATPVSDDAAPREARMRASQAAGQGS